MASALTEELKQSYTEQITYVLLNFVENISMEDAQAMHAKVKGKNTQNFSACISNMLLIFKTEYSQENEQSIENYLGECIAYFIERVQLKIKTYIESHNFGTDKTKMDPIKVHYFFIEALYEDDYLEDMDYLKSMLSNIFEDKFQENMYDLHLLNKTLDEAKKGNNKAEKINNLHTQYGTKGLYNTFKGTYKILKNKYGDEIENRL